MLTSKRLGSTAKLQIVGIYRLSRILCGFRYYGSSYDGTLYTASLFAPGLRSYHLFRFYFPGITGSQETAFLFSPYTRYNNLFMNIVRNI